MGGIEEAMAKKAAVLGSRESGEVIERQFECVVRIEIGDVAGAGLEDVEAEMVFGTSVGEVVSVEMREKRAFVAGERGRERNRAKEQTEHLCGGSKPDRQFRLPNREQMLTHRPRFRRPSWRKRPGGFSVRVWRCWNWV
jgi:hypothetical protein